MSSKVTLYSEATKKALRTLKALMPVSYCIFRFIWVMEFQVWWPKIKSAHIYQKSKSWQTQICFDLDEGKKISVFWMSCLSLELAMFCQIMQNYCELRHEESLISKTDGYKYLQLDLGLKINLFKGKF